MRICSAYDLRGLKGPSLSGLYSTEVKVLIHTCSGGKEGNPEDIYIYIHKYTYHVLAT